jgi:transcriptional regulator with PAS, ATPase and Fis domain
VEGRPDEREDAARIEHLFPQVTGEVLNALMAHSWPGNLRELERISFDLYWHLETRSGPDLEFVREQIHRLGLPPPSVASAEGPLLPSHEIARLQQIEKILLRHQLDIDAAGPELAAIRRKTPHLLREYLRKNERLLSEEFRNHRRAPLLLEPRTRKRREMKTALPVSV